MRVKPPGPNDIRFFMSDAIRAGMIGLGAMGAPMARHLAEGGLLAGAVMASDAFFPFRDSIDTAAEAGIRAVIQPGGSKRDEEVIAAADEHGMAMLLTGMRHFRH